MSEKFTEPNIEQNSHLPPEQQSAVPDLKMPIPAAAKRKLYIKTFGCQMNEYDSEKFEVQLAADHRRVDAPEDADVVIINTCSVREKGEHKLFSLLGSLAQIKRDRPEMVIGVGGCVAQQEGHKILKRSPGVDFVVGTHNISLVPSLVQAASHGAPPQVAIDYRDEWESLPADFDALSRVEESAQPAGPYPHMTPPVRALIAIQRGCAKRCSYCVVPTTRGDEVSRSPDEIERELRLKVRLGAKEVMLLGQTVNSYGRDLSPRYPFETLIRRLSKIVGLERIRFISPHPQEVRPGFLELYNDVPQLCPHIHLPLQSGSDRILKLMNRNYRTERYMEIVESLRERRPDIAITTDIIVGFPTETDEDFAATLEIMQRVGYDSSYSFKYSRRPNTTANLDYAAADHIPDDIVAARLKIQQQLQDRLSLQNNTAKIGKIFEVLVEGTSTNISSCLRGRIPQNTWAEIALEPGDRIPAAGELVQVLVDHASAWGIRGKLAEPGPA